LIAVDGKMVIDDNELDRRPDIAACATNRRKRRAKSMRATPTSRSSSSMATSAAS
jgi:succinyl-CoA synthetase beta subunit